MSRSVCTRRRSHVIEFTNENTQNPWFNCGVFDVAQECSCGMEGVYYICILYEAQNKLIWEKQSISKEVCETLVDFFMKMHYS